MTLTQLRQALTELNGERAVSFAFVGVHEPHTVLHVERAMLVPDEADHLIKVTDGRHIYIVDADRIAWVRIGLKTPLDM
ncbi:MAG: hypothetical protein EA378_01745 [Phycisphaerales bacterium]|nr:MAG: hypothetical protein EA378_01745 [Phycisphaerales bacterium]